jgi:ribosomal protein S18 acetylase RimI-like enzyme
LSTAEANPGHHFSFRQVLPADIDFFRELCVSTFYDAFGNQNSPENINAYVDNAYARDVLLKELCDQDSEHYFLCHDGTPIGFIKLNLAPNQTELRDADSIELQRIYVIKAYQNKGLGTMLLNKCKQRTRELGLGYLWLAVWEYNVDAIRFYERHGFEKFGKHPFIMGDDIQTDVLMKLRITN